MKNGDTIEELGKEKESLELQVKDAISKNEELNFIREQLTTQLEDLQDRHNLLTIERDGLQKQADTIPGLQEELDLSLIHI